MNYQCDEGLQEALGLPLRKRRSKQEVPPNTNHLQDILKPDKRPGSR